MKSNIVGFLLCTKLSCIECIFTGLFNIGLKCLKYEYWLNRDAVISKPKLIVIISLYKAKSSTRRVHVELINLEMLQNERKM